MHTRNPKPLKPPVSVALRLHYGLLVQLLRNPGTTTIEPMERGSPQTTKTKSASRNPWPEPMPQRTMLRHAEWHKRYEVAKALVTEDHTIAIERV